MAMRVVAARAGFAAALFAVLGLLSPVEASVAIWTSGDGSRALVRNASGLTVMIDVPKGLPPISTSGGAGALRATQALSLYGASAELGLSRAVSLSTIARGLRIATRLSGPVGLAGLAYDGITWAVDHWEKQAPDSYCYGMASSPGWEVCSISALEAKALELNPSWASDGGAKYRDGYGNTVATVCNKTFDWVCTQFSKTRKVDGEVVPASDADVELALSNALQADPSKAGPMIEWISESVPAYDFAPGPVEVTGPSSVQGPVETTTRQEGGNTYTTTNQTTYNLSFQGDTVTVTRTTNSTTVDQSNNVVSSTVTNTQASPSSQKAEEAVKPCGLPDTPPCKIDEAGTPKADETVSAGQNALKTAFDARDQQISQNTQRESFGWLPTLPTLSASCSTIQVGNIWTFDPCPGIEIGRTFFAFLWGFLALIYCWRRVGETVGGGV